MQRTSGHAITGWAAILAAPFLIPIALLLQLLPLKKTTDRTADEVAGFLRDFLEGTGGDWDWDEFETLPITDPVLDLIRQEAAMAGPGYTRESADFGKLTALLKRVEALP
jgi:hypothetical protein